MEVEQLLNSNEVAQILGVGSDHVRKLARDRKISHRRVGRKFLFSVEDVNEYRQGEVIRRAE